MGNVLTIVAIAMTGTLVLIAGSRDHVMSYGVSVKFIFDTMLPSLVSLQLKTLFPHNLSCTTAEKDENTRIQLLGNSSDFIAVYGRPMYLIRNMTGKPTSFLRLGYADTDVRDDHFNDDFFQYNNKSIEFRELLKNFTVVMYYTGLRWYGKFICQRCCPQYHVDSSDNCCFCLQPIIIL